MFRNTDGKTKTKTNKKTNKQTNKNKNNKRKEKKRRERTEWLNISGCKNKTSTERTKRTKQ